MRGRIIFWFIKSKTTSLPYPHMIHTVTANHYCSIIQLAALEMHSFQLRALKSTSVTISNKIPSRIWAVMVMLVKYWQSMTLISKNHWAKPMKWSAQNTSKLYGSTKLDVNDSPLIELHLALQFNSKVCILERDPDGLVEINLKRNRFCEQIHPPGRFLCKGPVAKHLLRALQQGQTESLASVSSRSVITRQKKSLPVCWHFRHF